MTLQSSSETISLLSCTDNISSVNISDVWLVYKIVQQFSTMDIITSALPTVSYQPWVWSLIGSVIVGLSGIFPLLVIPIEVEEGANLKNDANSQTLKVLLSFAVGGLLGDVFLHLLPEAWTLQQQFDNGSTSMFCGSWVLAGLLVFIIAEKVFSVPSTDEEEVMNIVDKDSLSEDKAEQNKEIILNNNDEFSDSMFHQVNKSNKNSTTTKHSSKQVAGYLNLMANSIDNFTHGLAVGGSFLISPRVGALTTFAILVHEVPHEVGDFAILLRAGFTRWDAAKAQLYTASAGIVGALTAVTFSGAGNTMEAKTSWILPFTAGGFLHIALVTVLPELLNESNPIESFKQLASLISGVVLMAVLTMYIE
uniref:Zinc transporter ZIP13 n=1 Tax=Clastoptera arizonana TaxID=38151 RepID=A0A1B6E318_9HEMI